MQTGISGFLRSSYSKFVIKIEKKLCKQVDIFNKLNEQLITKDSKEYKDSNNNLFYSQYTVLYATVMPPVMPQNWNYKSIKTLAAQGTICG